MGGKHVLSRIGKTPMKKSHITSRQDGWSKESGMGGRTGQRLVEEHGKKVTRDEAWAINDKRRKQGGRKRFYSEETFTREGGRDS